ncbi:MAG: lipocalin family protein [Sphaerochaeta sp.]|nr:lipocalin family protein [Sphaerochaeta sp.]
MESGRKALATVPSLDLERYLGRWYEIARWNVYQGQGHRLETR